MKSLSNSNFIIVLIFSGIIFLVEFGMPAYAKRIEVANNGQDSPTCGDVENPCRSISQAIENAFSEDKIIVGPGYYGDINGDGDFNDPGDEHAEIRYGCNCIIKIVKQVTLISKSGASSTIIEGNGDQRTKAVSINGNGINFGKKGNGFFIKSAYTGVTVYGNGVKVQGNIFAKNFTGLSLGGEGNIATHNVALNNKQGIVVWGMDNIVEKCAAIDNGQTGILVGSGPNKVRYSLSTGNSKGMAVYDSDNLVEYSLITGNKNLGVEIWSLTTSGTAVNNNVIYGNGSASNNCGFHNCSGRVISATGNYWGAAIGPGEDPADRICDDPGSTTIFEPFAEEEFELKISPFK